MKTFLFFRPFLPFFTNALYTQRFNRLLLPPSKPLATHIPFDQKVICDEIKKYDYIYKKLYHINKTYNGLCELICNYIIIKDLLDRTYNSDCLNKINVRELNKPTIKSSHIIENCSSFSIFKAYLFDSYPYTFFRPDEVVENNKINERLLSSKLLNINEGDYIKFFVFSRTFFNFKGHSMLIKKTGSDYTFFDPNLGADTHLSLTELCNKLNNVYAKYKGTNMAFIDGNKYIASLQPEELKPVFSL